MSRRRKDRPVATIPDPVQIAYETAAAQRTLSLPTIPEELRALEADDLRDGAGFTRCTFKNCKLTGASFMEANLEHVALEDCTLDFGAFNRCRFWAVSATRCDFSGADMAEMELHYVTLDDDRFIGTSFFRTPLLGLDFSTCQLEGVALSDTMAEIYGTKMNVYQAAALARRLGVIVAE